MDKQLDGFVLGNPMDERTNMGPLIRESDAIRVEETIKQAASAGARIIRGGKRSGNFVEPAIVADATRDMTICNKELFGPAVAFMPFKTFDEAVEGANDTNYGLSSGIYTKDINTAMEFILEANPPTST